MNTRKLGWCAYVFGLLTLGFASVFFSTACSPDTIDEVSKVESLISSAVDVLENSGAVPAEDMAYIDSATTFVDFVTDDLVQTETPEQHALNIAGDAVNLIPLSSLGVTPPAWAVAIDSAVRAMLTSYQTLATSAPASAASSRLKAHALLKATPAQTSAIALTPNQAGRVATIRAKNALLKARITKLDSHRVSY